MYIKNEIAMDDGNNFVESLIDNVKNHRCLYDKTDEFYYNRNIKEKAWKQISEECFKSVGDCKHRWKLLRERFVKELKRLEAPSSSGMSNPDKWKFLHPLMFLKDSLGPRRTRDSVEEQDVKSVLEHSILRGDNSPDPPMPSRKKTKTSLDSLYKKFGKTIEKLEQSFSTTSKGDALDDAFLTTANCLMKGLPDTVKDEFQSRMLQELYRLRREHKRN